jgi:hypothetical protein
MQDLTDIQKERINAKDGDNFLGLSEKYDFGSAYGQPIAGFSRGDGAKVRLSSYDKYLKRIVHEIGHNLGLGEKYNLNGDLKGYENDPMSANGALQNLQWHPDRAKVFVKFIQRVFKSNKPEEVEKFTYKKSEHGTTE